MRWLWGLSRACGCSDKVEIGCVLFLDARLTTGKLESRRSLLWLAHATSRRGVGETQRDKSDKSGALQGGDRASAGIAFLGPSRAPFQILFLDREGGRQAPWQSALSEWSFHDDSPPFKFKASILRTRNWRLRH